MNSFRLVFLALVLMAMNAVPAQRATSLPRLKVSADHRIIVREDGRPFFYLADTAWELLHRLNRKEAAEYLRTRAQQGYTVVQAVALAELDGITDPNPYGKLPLTDRDPTKPAITPGANPDNNSEYDYWDHVDYIVDEANRSGIYVGLLPTWGRWVVKRPTAPNEVIFDFTNAQSYGEFLGKRYGKQGIIWILGGDRTADGVEDVWRALARGIAIGVSGKEDYSKVFMGFHPRGGGTSSTWFQKDEWLDVNMQQTGHGLAETVQPWKKVAADYGLTQPKPVIDAEPL